MDYRSTPSNARQDEMIRRVMQVGTEPILRENRHLAQAATIFPRVAGIKWYLEGDGEGRARVLSRKRKVLFTFQVPCPAQSYSCRRGATILWVRDTGEYDIQWIEKVAAKLFLQARFRSQSQIPEAEAQALAQQVEQSEVQYQLDPDLEVVGIEFDTEFGTLQWKPQRSHTFFAEVWNGLVRVRREGEQARLVIGLMSVPDGIYEVYWDEEKRSILPVRRDQSRKRLSTQQEWADACRLNYQSVKARDLFQKESPMYPVIEEVIQQSQMCMDLHTGEMGFAILTDDGRMMLDKYTDRPPAGVTRDQLVGTLYLRKGVCDTTQMLIEYWEVAEYEHRSAIVWMPGTGIWQTAKRWREVGQRLDECTGQLSGGAQTKHQ